jgi:GNAT superfamily N-acetyltransferase
MWWRLPSAQFAQNNGEPNRKALESIVNSGQAPGILAYAGSEAVGWCAVAPREEYQRLERSGLLRRVDDQPVWSVVCFFIARKFRRRGITIKLLQAAIDLAKARGGKIIEGYPVDPGKKRTPDSFAYTGLVSSFRQAGFTEVARRSKTRLIMRYEIG